MAGFQKWVLQEEQIQAKNELFQLFSEVGF